MTSDHWVVSRNEEGHPKEGEWLDRAPKGRNERNETGAWFRRHDEYANPGAGAH